MFSDNDATMRPSKSALIALVDDVVLDTESWRVACPYCGEESVIGLDPGGGTTQDYVRIARSAAGLARAVELRRDRGCRDFVEVATVELLARQSADLLHISGRSDACTPSGERGHVPREPLAPGEQVPRTSGRRS